MSRLVTILEGGVFTLEYLHGNGVFPEIVVTDPSKFRELVPYLDEEDEILLIVKGLTDFTVSEIYAIIEDFESLGDSVKSLCILSNIDLGMLDYEYFLYSGDLFYSTSVMRVLKGKKTPLDEEVKGKSKKKEKSSDTLSIGGDTNPTNGVAARYLVYSKRDVKVTIHDAPAKEQEVDINAEYVLSKLVKVDLFENIPQRPYLIPTGER